MGIYTDRYFFARRSPRAVDFVGAGSPEFLLATNNLHKPAPTPPIISIVDCFGAGFYDLSVGVNDVGKPAPTGFMEI
jgi:hypothetical protein